MTTLRGTGRTTRMLEMAIAEARKPQYVMVVAANQRDADRLKEQCAKMLGRKPSGPKVYLAADGEPYGGEITFDPVDGEFDWKTLRVRGAYPTIPVFVDHFAIEAEFGHILRELHRYDA